MTKTDLGTSVAIIAEYLRDFSKHMFPHRCIVRLVAKRFHLCCSLNSICYAYSFHVGYIVTLPGHPFREFSFLQGDLPSKKEVPCEIR